jgi:hypothetical protein
MEAPASQHLTTSSVISSGEQGTYGVISLETGSPPVTAAVMMSFTMKHCYNSFYKSLNTNPIYEKKSSDKAK